MQRAQLLEVGDLCRPADSQAGLLVDLGDQMEVDMVHFLVRDPTVVLKNVVARAFGPVHVAANGLHQSLGDWQQVCQVLVGQVMQLASMELGDDQDMLFRSRLDVEERV